MRRLPAWTRTSRQPDRRRPRLVPIGLAIAVLLALAVGAAVALIFIALAWFNPQTVGEHLDVVKISLAVIAGIGGVVALVVAYRRQRIAEAGEHREQSRLYAERFDKASDKLGSDSPAVRLAGVHALANLADDWSEGRQTCVDVLCAYLRMPPGPEPDPGGDPDDLTQWLAMREVRTTVVHLITAHMRRGSVPSWHGCNLNFAGVIFDTEVDFTDAQFTAGEVSFDGATFSGDRISFYRAEFSGGRVYFPYTKFSGDEVSFGADFTGGSVSFYGAEFSSEDIGFDSAEFVGGDVDFSGTDFSGDVHFRNAGFLGGGVNFAGAKFSSGKVDFSEVANWSYPPRGLPQAPHDIVVYPKPPAMPAPPPGVETG